MRRFAIEWLLLVCFALPAVVLAQSEPNPPSTLPDNVPIGGAIAVPVPDSSEVDVTRFEVPELVGARQAIGSQLVDGKLPEPFIDFVSVTGAMEERISIFQNGLAVLHLKGAGATIRKRMILPDDAMKSYHQNFSAATLDALPPELPGSPTRTDYASIRITNDGKAVERRFGTRVILPLRLDRMRAVLQDLIRAMAIDREVTNPITGYVPSLGDRLISDDQKLYRVTRILDQGKVVELTCVHEPTKVYFSVKDLYTHFIAALGDDRSPNRD